MFLSATTEKTNVSILTFQSFECFGYVSSKGYTDILLKMDRSSPRLYVSVIACVCVCVCVSVLAYPQDSVRVHLSDQPARQTVGSLSMCVCVCVCVCLFVSLYVCVLEYLPYNARITEDKKGSVHSGDLLKLHSSEVN